MKKPLQTNKVNKNRTKQKLDIGTAPKLVVLQRSEDVQLTLETMLSIISHLENANETTRREEYASVPQ